jgi:hypothetical protein
MAEGNDRNYTGVALAFANALASRDYAGAYALASRSYRESRSLDDMRAEFETIVPLDWTTVGPIEIGQTMQDWPGRKPTDAGWVYVSVGGDVYSEAITVVVTREDDELKVRTVEFGRP